MSSAAQVDPQPTGPRLDVDALLKIYETVCLIRRSETSISRLLKSGQAAFSFYPVTGQEITPAVLAQTLAPDDQLVTLYRGLADCLAKGVPLSELVAEYLGRPWGVCKGLGGPMGISRPDLGLMMTTGIVGSGAPIAVGLGLASQLQGTGKVAAVSFGDGATSIGAVHEAMNMAALWKLPVLFVCHNNQWSESTPLEEYATIDRFAKRAAAYGMAGVTVDGADPEAVRAVLDEAIDRARGGGGPTFVESMTYRLSGHYFADAGAYMDQARLAEERNHDPVPLFRQSLLDRGVDLARLEQVEAKVQGLVDSEIAIAMSPATVPATEVALHAHVYADPGLRPIISQAVEVPPEPVWPTRKTTMRDAINEALALALEQDSAVVLMGEDIADPAGGVLGVTKGLSTRFGADRVRSTPIAEQAIFGAAVGASIAGMRPVAELLLMDFLSIALDQMSNHAAKARFMTGGHIHAPMTMITPVGQGNGAQHSQSLEAWLMHCPGLKVIYPSTPADAKGLLLSAIFDDDPCVFIEPMPVLFTPGEVPEGDYRIPLGVAKVRREGGDVSIITYGPAVADALTAAEALAQEGIDAEVIDLRTLVPMDGAAILASVAKTGRAVVAQRTTQFMGPSAEIAAFIQDELFGRLKGPVKRVGGAYTPVPRSPELLQLYYKGAAAIAQAAREIF